MPLLATKGPYTLIISCDDDPICPRADYANFGTMCCWHSRYNLGDEHYHKEPKELMAALVKESMSDEQLIAYIKNGNEEDMRFYYDRSDRGWRLESYDDHFKKWFEDYFIDRPLNPDDKNVIAAIIRENLSMRSLSELAERAYCILPLYLYDHSGITMSISAFSCPWDSGQIGYIYVSHEDVETEYGAVNDETLSKAMTLLESEVECYDYYLTGQCYGYEFYKEGAEVDSCWGYLGDLQDMQDEIEGWLPDECKGLTDELSEVNEPIDLSDYWECPEDEAEQDDEWEDER